MMEPTTNEDQPPSLSSHSEKRWWKNLFSKPKKYAITTRAELISEIRLAEGKGLIEADELGMIEGVMQVDHLQARDIMLSRSQIQFIHRDDSYQQILSQVLKSGHSRYPVVDENRDDIEGILHAKDLLKFIGKDKHFAIDDILRPPLYAPETRRLDELLTEFKKSRNHMAVIVDEYGGISGLITIEDVLEQIVGEIDDEHDVDEKPNIQKRDSGVYTVNALTPVEEFNNYFDAREDLTPFDTIGGLVTHRMGKIPHQAEELATLNFHFTVLSSDGRRIQLLEVKPLIKPKNDKVETPPTVTQRKTKKIASIDSLDQRKPHDQHDQHEENKREKKVA